MLSSIMFRSKSASPSSDAAPPSADSAALQAKVAFLNQSLETLHEVFPGRDVDEIRRLLASAPDESRLYVITEMLLKSGCRVPTSTRVPPLEPWEKFRSAEYKNAVKKTLYALPCLAPLSVCPSPPPYAPSPICLPCMPSFPPSIPFPPHICPFPPCALPFSSPTPINAGRCLQQAKQPQRVLGLVQIDHPGRDGRAQFHVRSLA